MAQRKRTQAQQDSYFEKYIDERFAHIQALLENGFTKINLEIGEVKKVVEKQNSRIGKLEQWKSKVIGMATGAGALAGAAFKTIWDTIVKGQ